MTPPDPHTWPKALHTYAVAAVCVVVVAVCGVLLRRMVLCFCFFLFSCRFVLCCGVSCVVVVFLPCRAVLSCLCGVVLCCVFAACVFVPLLLVFVHLAPLLPSRCPTFPFPSLLFTCAQAETLITLFLPPLYPNTPCRAVLLPVVLFCFRFVAVCGGFLPDLANFWQKNSRGFLRPEISKFWSVFGVSVFLTRDKTTAWCANTTKVSTQMHGRGVVRVKGNKCFAQNRQRP